MAKKVSFGLASTAGRGSYKPRKPRPKQPKPRTEPEQWLRENNVPLESDAIAFLRNVVLAHVQGMELLVGLHRILDQQFVKKLKDFETALGKLLDNAPDLGRPYAVRDLALMSDLTGDRDFVASSYLWQHASQWRSSLCELLQLAEAVEDLPSAQGRPVDASSIALVIYYKALVKIGRVPELGPTGIKNLAEYLGVGSAADTVESWKKTIRTVDGKAQTRVSEVAGRLVAKHGLGAGADL